MMTMFQLATYLTASIAIFVSYQMIPHNLDRLRGTGAMDQVATSTAFTLFVRFCGINHMIMAGAMFVMVAVPHRWSEWFGWAVACGETATAVVSLISWRLIAKAAR